MKKINLVYILNIPEIILLVCYFVGIMLRIMHWPGANLFLTLVLLTLPNMYFIFGTFTFSGIDPRSLKRDTNYDLLLKSKLIIGFLCGVTLMIYTLQIWASLLRLPVAGIFQTVSLFLAGIVIISIITVAFKKPGILWVLGRFILSVLGLLSPALVLGWLRG